MTRKKKQPQGPRRKRMTREARIQSARSTRWVERYAGNNIIKGYGKWFAVDPLCAIIELRMLGVAIDKERERQIMASIEARASAQKLRREALAEAQREEAYEDRNDIFAFIAGHTAGGAPFGLTWEEIGEDPPWRRHESVESSLPPDKQSVVAHGAGAKR